MRAAAGEHLLDHGLVAIHALHLVERAFVVVSPDPVHAIENRLYRLGCQAFQIGVFDAQDERAAVFAGKRPENKAVRTPPMCR